jgi:hypothetical protein
LTTKIQIPKCPQCRRKAKVFYFSKTRPETIFYNYPQYWETANKDERNVMEQYTFLCADHAKLEMSLLKLKNKEVKLFSISNNLKGYHLANLQFDEWVNIKK